MTEEFWDIADAAWAWIATPPLWAAYALLIVIGISAIASALGSERLIRLTRFLFKKDTRLAEMIALTDERKLARVRSAEERLNHIRKSGLDRLAREHWARVIREQGYFWSDLAPPENPKPMLEMEPQIAMHGKNYIDMRFRQLYHDMFSPNYSRDNGATRIRQMASTLNYQALEARFNENRRKWQQSEPERDLEARSYFPDDVSRKIWKEALCSYWAFNQTRNELSRSLNDFRSPTSLNAPEEYLPRLPLDTATEIQP